MIDPLTLLSFSIHSGRGTYALLVGSGISRAAQIPTGWEITLDLIQKVAAANGEDCGAAPESWYKSKFGKDPDYSELLAELALTPAERTNALRGYFEGGPEELAEGKKVPTLAHKVIARLVKAGYFKVVITTNFDRLLEQALAAEGVNPVVISTADMATGAIPLAHADATVVKVHGDYRDTRFKNTSQELSKYDPNIDALLDRVFDEYGLIVCGWSAQWDEALRTAILRCPNRRYSMFWTVRGTISERADELIKFRGASVIPIESADKFFQSLEDKLEALDRLNSPHPLSATLAVASLKKFVVEDRFRIQLNDLVMSEVERLFAQLSSLNVSAYSLDCDSIKQRLELYENSSQILTALIANGCFWGTEEQAVIWSRAIIRILDLAPMAGGTTVLLNLRRYPALLALYAGGIACVAADKYGTLKVLLRDSRTSIDAAAEGKDAMLVRKMAIYEILPGEALNKCSNQNRKTPCSDRLHKELREIFRTLIPSDVKYDDLFDRWEYMLSLVGFDTTTDDGGYFSAAVGRFGWRNRGFGRDSASITVVLFDEFVKKNSLGGWAPITSGLFESPDRFVKAVEGFKEQRLDHFSSY